MTRSGEHVPRWTDMQCDDCGGWRNVSQRHANAIANGKARNVCRYCRYPNSETAVKETHRNYWLARYSMSEIREMAAGLELLLPDHSRGAKRRRVA